MKYAVIDVGSNSIRLMISEDGQTLYKKLETTKLGEGLSGSGKLKDENITKSLAVLKNFISEANGEGIKSVSIFGTEAIRKAVNADIFLSEIRRMGQKLVVLEPSEEAELGYVGAARGKSGKLGMIDIGGASTEITYGNGDKIIYTKSQPIGVRRILDECGRDRLKTLNYVKDFLSVYEKPDSLDEMFSIGGTATSIASIMLGLEIYNPVLVNGFKISESCLKQLTQKLFAMKIDEIKRIKGLDEKRADVIAGGSLMLLETMNYLGLKEVTVSESDNLEGYLIKRVLKK